MSPYYACKLLHVKGIGVLVDVCTPHSSLNWCQIKVAEAGKFKKSNIEIKKETACQNKYTGLGLVAYGY